MRQFPEGVDAENIETLNQNTGHVMLAVVLLQIFLSLVLKDNLGELICLVMNF